MGTRGRDCPSFSVLPEGAQLGGRPYSPCSSLTGRQQSLTARHQLREFRDAPLHVANQHLSRPEILQVDRLAYIQSRRPAATPRIAKSAWNHGDWGSEAPLGSSCDGGEPALERKNLLRLRFRRVVPVNIRIAFRKHHEDATLAEKRDRIIEGAPLMAPDGAGPHELLPPRLGDTSTSSVAAEDDWPAHHRSGQSEQSSSVVVLHPVQGHQHMNRTRYRD